MADVAVMTATMRNSSGKGPARRARRDGQVPGIIYGNREEPMMLTLEYRRLVKALGDNRFFIRLLDLEVDGKKHRVLPREIQFHPVSDAPIHIDFLRFDPSRKIPVAVPVRFDGERESPGIRRGGMLNIVRYDVEVLCTADRIPSELEIDVSELEIGDSVHASSITLPAGVEFVITDRDFTVATVAAPTVIADEEEGEEVEDEDEADAEDENLD